MGARSEVAEEKIKKKIADLVQGSIEYLFIYILYNATLLNIWGSQNLGFVLLTKMVWHETMHGCMYCVIQPNIHCMRDWMKQYMLACNVLFSRSYIVWRVEWNTTKFAWVVSFRQSYTVWWTESKETHKSKCSFYNGSATTRSSITHFRFSFLSCFRLSECF